MESANDSASKVEPGLLRPAFAVDNPVVTVRSPREKLGLDSATVTTANDGVATATCSPSTRAYLSTIPARSSFLASGPDMAVKLEPTFDLAKLGNNNPAATNTTTQTAAAMARALRKSNRTTLLVAKPVSLRKSCFSLLRRLPVRRGFGELAFSAWPTSSASLSSGSACPISAQNLAKAASPFSCSRSCSSSNGLASPSSIATTRASSCSQDGLDVFSVESLMDVSGTFQRGSEFLQ